MGICQMHKLIFRFTFHNICSSRLSAVGRALHSKGKIFFLIVLFVESKLLSLTVNDVYIAFLLLNLRFQPSQWPFEFNTYLRLFKFSFFHFSHTILGLALHATYQLEFYVLVCLLCLCFLFFNHFCIAACQPFLLSKYNNSNQRMHLTARRNSLYFLNSDIGNHRHAYMKKVYRNK